VHKSTVFHVCDSVDLLRHALERLGEVLLAEGELALGPDLGVLYTFTTHQQLIIQYKPMGGQLTGLSVFLISLSSEPPLRATTGAASGSWAMGEPHSEQNQRQTALPESAVPFHFFRGPWTVILSWGTTQTRAVEQRR